MRYDINAHLIELGFRQWKPIKGQDRLFQLITPETNLIVNLSKEVRISDGRPSIEHSFYKGPITSREQLQDLLSKFKGNTPSA